MNPDNLGNLGPNSQTLHNGGPTQTFRGKTRDSRGKLSILPSMTDSVCGCKLLQSPEKGLATSSPRPVGASVALNSINMHNSDGAPLGSKNARYPKLSFAVSVPESLQFQQWTGEIISAKSGMQTHIYILHECTLHTRAHIRSAPAGTDAIAAIAYR